MASLVWEALGQPGHYIEPFFGSGAVLLARPNWNPAMTETVNDKDGFIANVWRSIQFSPEETAKWCDWPVNHADLVSRKAELLQNEEKLLEGLISDPKWHDPVLAGYWIWAASCWIGSGLTTPSKRLQRPHLTDTGQGVHSKRPHINDTGAGIHRKSKRGTIYDWFDQLSYRLRRVRVVCGEWFRVCGGNWQESHWDSAGFFLDPPYAIEDRDSQLYHQDSMDMAHSVREWCKRKGAKKNVRIVLAGYDEHEELLEHGWTKEVWRTSGGYGNTARKKESEKSGIKNKTREVLYLSPHCNRTRYLI